MNQERGFTLIEMLIVVTVLVLVTGGAFMLTYQGQKTFRTQYQLAQVTREARIAMDVMARYLRQAGNDPLEALAVPPIEILGEDFIRINADITGSVPSTTPNPMESTGDPDGTLQSIHERVTIRYDQPSRQLLMDIGYGEEVIGGNVADFELSFLDISGNPATDPNRIARVRITMVSETDLPDPTTGEIQRVTFQSDVFLRSRSFELFADAGQ